ncbi:MAG: hypothetical protein GY854_25465 [Deltaproteobacteria bacterium]|nr:hypothetical protein [Deltaproteobacteria bacterium]
MKNQTITKLIWGVALLGFIMTEEANGAGFDNPAVGLRGHSMSSAYHGIADDASAVYYNPAGLALIEPGEMNIEASTYFVFTDFDYTVGEETSKSTEMPILPGFFISHSLDDGGVGLGFYAPYGGGGVVYKDFLGNEGEPYESAAGFFALSAAAGVEIVKKYLSIGLTPSIYFGMMERLFYQPNATLPPGTAVQVHSKNTGFAGVGATLGIMSKPIPQLGIGVTVRSPVKVKMSGENTVTMKGFGPEDDVTKTDSDIALMLPMETTLGVGLTPIEQLTIGFSFAVVFHGQMEEITVIPAEGENIVSETHYKHAFWTSLAAEYMIIKQLGVRAGVKFTQSPAKDDGLIPDNNDINQLVPTVGLVWNIVDFLALDVAGAHVFGFERQRDDEVTPGVNVTSKYDADHWILLAGLRFNWNFIK